MRTDELNTAKSEYLTFCKESRSLSRNTLLAYEQDLICFNRYYELQNNEAELNQTVVLSYLRFLREIRNLRRVYRSCLRAGRYGFRRRY